MFDVEATDIERLNDADLRELVGRLCEAELASRGISAAAVTWGGRQTAPDGGLDVRVALPPTAFVEGFIPRAATGFQVKTPDMPRSDIISEMRPAGTIRSVIQELANEAGAYVIVSSKGSTADSALRSRRKSMREALVGASDADRLHTDFYDRTRLATWVRNHPGLVAWVREKVGRAFVGWRPFGNWDGALEGVEAEYLVDDKLRLDIGRRGDEPRKSVIEALDELRDILAQPGNIVRLVGLSGVGKTRLAQALFDARVGARPLSSSMAVYSNLSDDPDPQPVGLVSDLMAWRMRAILIVDNCPPDLHRRLSNLCTGPESTLSVLTVEYDVRDDQPEGTQVATLETSSLELIQRLVLRRYLHLSQIDARAIADASGGNARIAIAIAETVERSETIAGLSDDELFQRLFRQRQNPDNALLLAAQACSLVYSFNGDTLTGNEAEIPRLASLIGQAPAETYRHVSELLRRGLAQRRGIWRAVLPHAVANYLARRAIEDIPFELLEQQLVTGGTERLACSFSRRLSYLHDHPQALEIVERWLAPDGLLGDAVNLSAFGRAMFENVAPVSPDATLKALERARLADADMATDAWMRHHLLLRSLAYDPALFERSALLLAQAATKSVDDRTGNEARKAFVSLFPILLSGTHATIKQRLQVIETLLRSPETKRNALGIAALDAILKTMHFNSVYSFEFGARSRDYGYHAKEQAEICVWYGAALALIQRLAFDENLLNAELGTVVARNLRDLWQVDQLHDHIVSLVLNFAANRFWREGWAACRQTLRLDKKRLNPESLSPLVALEAALKPTNLPDQVRAVVLGDWSGGIDGDELDLEGDIESQLQRFETIAQELGTEVAADEQAFADLLPDIIQGGKRVFAFGRGLAGASQNRSAIWSRLVRSLPQPMPEERNIHVLRGFLAEVWERDRDLGQALLDESLEHSHLAALLPVLQSAVQLDERGLERLKHILLTGHAPVWTFRYLFIGPKTDQVAGSDLRDLILLIAAQPDGFGIAVENLSMRFHSDRSAKRPHNQELLKVGRELLRVVTFTRTRHLEDYQLADVARTCLAGPEAGPIASEVATRLRQAVSEYETYAFDNDDLLKALLGSHPIDVLNNLFDGDDQDRQAGKRVFEHLQGHRLNPADIIASDALLKWCEQDRDVRYVLAASIVSFKISPDGAQTQIWSAQAKELLANCPDPRRVLEIFVRRFQPTSWSGSRATLMEANVRLLDEIGSQISPDLVQMADQMKHKIQEQIIAERRRELERDRNRDERFE